MDQAVNEAISLEAVRPVDFAPAQVVETPKASWWASLWRKHPRWSACDEDENLAGVQPLEYKVLVKPSAIEVDPAIVRAKKSGLAIPQEVLDKELMAQIIATFVAAGGNAFEDWKDKRLPKAGDSVLIAKYAGVTLRGADGEEYRMLNDKDIAGLITAKGVSRV